MGPCCFKGQRWRDMWLVRLKNEPLLLENWLRHQHRDAFWKHGSVCENYGAITCAVYAIGGWEDSYSNAVPRLLAEDTDAGLFAMQWLPPEQFPVWKAELRDGRIDPATWRGATMKSGSREVLVWVAVSESCAAVSPSKLWKTLPPTH